MICELSQKTLKNGGRTELENTLMIVRGEIAPQVTNDIRDLYRFLKLCAGNYRNALYVECRCDFLMIADQDAKPVLFPVQKFYDLTGEYPQKDEMCSVMSKQSFENMYRGWLLWNTDGTECPVRSMYEKMKAEVL